MSRIHEGLSVEELAAIVWEALHAAGIKAVLSGGSVATIYSNHQWESFDLDFIVARVEPKRIDETLTELGFEKESEGWFHHPNHSHYVNPSPWPPMIGDETVDHWDTLNTAAGDLEILTPTQCVKDRLTGFYHGYDRQSLDRAVAVCLAQDVDIEEVTRWSESERPDPPEKIEEFMDALERAKAAAKR